jgi:hypothetical protein
VSPVTVASGQRPRLPYSEPCYPPAPVSHGPVPAADHRARAPSLRSSLNSTQTPPRTPPPSLAAHHADKSCLLMPRPLFALSLVHVPPRAQSSPPPALLPPVQFDHRRHRYNAGNRGRRYFPLLVSSAAPFVLPFRTPSPLPPPPGFTSWCSKTSSPPEELPVAGAPPLKPPYPPHSSSTRRSGEPPPPPPCQAGGRCPHGASRRLPRRTLSASEPMTTAQARAPGAPHRSGRPSRCATGLG